MTLDEAIEHAKEKTEEQKKQGSICCDSLEDTIRAEKCLECAREHEQLAEWLEELKERREAQEHDFCQECAYENTQVCKKCNILKPNMFKQKENNNEQM